MKFRELPLKGAFLVDSELHQDARGSFSRTWCAREFADAGLTSSIVQSSISVNKQCHTIRGMHMQLPPSQEAKLVRCVHGSIVDVIVDLRPHSPTFLQHHSVELRADLGNALYIPMMMAHGFQTLENDTAVLYQMTDVFTPELGAGWRWDDPAFGIHWPHVSAITISERDATYNDFSVVDYQQLLAKHDAFTGK